ncbi:MAG TPA: hypothetical protein VNE62_12080 [Actinomycetota bacterium]|nr:hypothetical protein [Actinomycetota bacterium]
MIPRVRVPLRRVQGEAGFQVLELSIAAGILAVVIAGLSGAMLSGMNVVGMSRQRTAAASLATERVERIRNLGFDQVALTEQPVHNPDPQNPDNAVTTDNTSYRVGAATEPLIVSSTGGAVRHIEDPVLSGPTELYIYQYVTWVDDPAIAGTQNYKRATVIVTWRRPLKGAVSSRIGMSTFVGKGTVSVPAATPTFASPSPSPSSTPTPVPTIVPGICVGDTTAPTDPTLRILSGAGADNGFTNSTGVQTRLQAQDACSVVTAQLSNNGSSFTDVATLPSAKATTVSWTVPGGDGTKTVWARFVDGAGNRSSVVQGSIVLDQTKPTAPGSLRTASCSISSDTRSVSLTWNASTDANLSGYRLYVSVNSDPFQFVAPTSSTSITSTSSKSMQSVRYMVRAYDKAGNESPDSSILTFTKNSC